MEWTQKKRRYHQQVFYRKRAQKKTWKQSIK